MLCYTLLLLTAPVVVEWGPCSRLCGAGGLQFRTVGNDTENRTCNEQSCHNEHCLAGIYTSYNTLLYLRILAVML